MKNDTPGPLREAAAASRRRIFGRLQAFAAMGVDWGLAHPLHLFVALGSLIPLIVLCMMVRQYASNVPFWDDWDVSYPVATQTAQGTLSVDTVVAERGVIRPVFTALVAAVSTLTTRWDLRAEMFVGILMACLTVILVMRLIYGHKPALVWLLLVPLAVFILSLRQYENWLMGFHAQINAMMAFMVAAVVLLTTRLIRWPNLAAAALLAVCATFSHIGGIVTWGVVLVGLWLLGDRDWRHYAFWIAATAASLGAFFAGYIWDPLPPGENVTAGVNRVYYVAVFLSGGLLRMSSAYTHPPIVAGLTAAGLALLATNGAYLWRNEHKIVPLAPWLMLIGMAIGLGVMTSTARTQLGVAQATSPRYVAYSNPFWVGIIVISTGLIDTLRRKQVRRWWETSLAAVNLLAMLSLAGLLVAADAGSVGDFQGFAGRIRTGRDCLRAYPLTQDIDCAISIYPEPDTIRPKILELMRLRLTTFSRPYDLPISAIPFDPHGQQIIRAAYTSHTIGGLDAPVLIQQPPSVLSISVNPVQSNLRVILHSSIYVDPAYGIAHPSVPEGGVLFQVWAVNRAGKRHVVYEQVFDPAIDHAPIPLELDLGALTNAVRIEFQTSARDNASYDEAMWVNPTVTIASDSP